MDGPLEKEQVSRISECRLQALLGTILQKKEIREDLSEDGATL